MIEIYKSKSKEKEWNCLVKPKIEGIILSLSTMMTLVSYQMIKRLCHLYRRYHKYHLLILFGLFKDIERECTQIQHLETKLKNNHNQILAPLQFKMKMKMIWNQMLIQTNLNSMMMVLFIQRMIGEMVILMKMIGMRQLKSLKMKMTTWVTMLNYNLPINIIFQIGTVKINFKFKKWGLVKNMMIVW